MKNTGMLQCCQNTPRYLIQLYNLNFQARWWWRMPRFYRRTSRSLMASFTWLTRSYWSQITWAGNPCLSPSDKPAVRDHTYIHPSWSPTLYIVTYVHLSFNKCVFLLILRFLYGFLVNNYPPSLEKKSRKDTNTWIRLFKLWLKLQFWNHPIYIVLWYMCIHFVLKRSF